jgi:hypothetical protein
MRRDYQSPSSASILVKWGAVVLGLGAIVAVGFYLLKDEVKRPPKLHELPAPVVAAPAVAPAEPAAAPVYEEPVPAPIPQPLPDLSQSDASVLASIQALGINGLLEMVVHEEILRKFVRAVAIAEEGKIVTEYRPISSPQGVFAVDSFTVKVSGGEGAGLQDVEQFRVSPKNYFRYTLFVQVMSALDSDAAINTYKRFYPLLNNAYKELGMGKGNFHSVLIRAIDKALAAPEANGDLILVRPKVYYEFADPALESLSEVHKLMLRMGPDNEAKMKLSLKNIRQKLVQR